MPVLVKVSIISNIICKNTCSYSIHQRAPRYQISTFGDISYNGLYHRDAGTKCMLLPLFFQELLLKDQMKDFAANIYEAFSDVSSHHTPLQPQAGLPCTNVHTVYQSGASTPHSGPVHREGQHRGRGVYPCIGLVIGHVFCKI